MKLPPISTLFLLLMITQKNFGMERALKKACPNSSPITRAAQTAYHRAPSTALASQERAPQYFDIMRTLKGLASCAKGMHTARKTNVQSIQRLDQKFQS